MAKEIDTILKISEERIFDHEILIRGNVDDSQIEKLENMICEISSLDGIIKYIASLGLEVIACDEGKGAVFSTFEVYGEKFGKTLRAPLNKK